MTQQAQVMNVCIFFLILITADNSYDSIITHMFQERKIAEVGPLSQAILCMSYSISFLIAPTIQISLKKHFLLAVVLILSNFILGLISTFYDQQWKIYILVFAGTFLNGFGSGCLQFSQNRYIHMICQIYNNSTQRGKDFALFDTFYSLAMFLGAVVTLFGLGFLNTKFYFYILIFFALLTMVFGIVFLNDIQQIQNKRIEQILSQADTSQNLKIQLINRINEVMEEEETRLSIRENGIPDFTKNVIAFLPYTTCIIPMVIVLSIGTVVKYNFFANLIPISLPKEVYNKLVGVGQIMGGLGCIGGSHFAGHFFDKFGAVFVGRKGLIIFFLCCWFHFIALQIQNLILGLLLTFVWGYAKSTLQGLCLTICSKHYSGRSEAVAIYKIVNSLNYTTFQFFLTLSKNKINPNLFILFSLLAIPAFFLLSRVINAYPKDHVKNNLGRHEIINQPTRQ